MKSGVDRYGIRGKVKLGTLRRDRQYTAATAILRRLYGLNEPGVILADEVGLGKTYVAYGVAGWLLQHKPRARVLVLTNSKQMMETWDERWGQIAFLQGQRPDSRMAWSWEEFRDIPRSSHLVISSYETLKGFRNADEAGVRASLGKWLFRPCHHPGKRLQAGEVAALQRALDIDRRRRTTQPKREMPASRGRDFWHRHFDWQERLWHDPEEATAALDELEIRYSPIAGNHPQHFDLVIVDEAHRLDAKGRQAAMELLLLGRTDKILYVTATPFALSVAQLKSLLECFRFCSGTNHEELRNRIERIGLAEFERAVAARQKYPGLADLERRLRRWIVRRTWEETSNAMGRRAETWAIRPDLKAGFLCTVALERAIAEMLRDSDRTHISSRRVSLCSSWAAARKSLQRNPIGDAGSPARRWTDFASRVLRRNASTDSPKLQQVASRIAGLVRDGSKVLVFSERGETLTKLSALLRPHLKEWEQQARKRNEKLHKHLHRTKEIHHLDEWWIRLQYIAPILGGSIRPWGVGWTAARRRARQCWKALGTERLKWVDRRSGKAMAKRAILKSVEVFDGERGDAHTLRRFNLPGMPWVLLCSKKGQESIDLHHECNTIVLLDPVWNPAHREQRIGRVHRLGSRFRQVRVIDVYTEGTYEEVIFRKASQRAEMMRVLLGAGRWLDADLEIDPKELTGFRVDLSPVRDWRMDLRLPG